MLELQNKSKFWKFWKILRKNENFDFFGIFLIIEENLDFFWKFEILGNFGKCWKFEILNI